MKAITCRRYGSPEVLRLEELNTPSPQQGEILIQVKATNVFPGDCEMRAFKIHPSMWLPVRLFLGVFKPRKPILGQEFAGVVVEVGENAKYFKPGDKVFGSTGFRLGSYAEYVCLPSNYVMQQIPDTISFSEAATITLGAGHALHFLRKGKVQANDKVLIYGAGGCIGTYAIQLAKHLGAEVNAVDSQEKLGLLTKLGADHVIDYRTEDFTQNGKTYDVILDLPGKSPYSRSLRSLNKNGRYLLANVGFGPMLRGVWTTLTTDKTVISALAYTTKDDLAYITQLVVDGVLKPVIDKTFALADMIEAHRYIDSGLKQGHVVATVN